MRKLKREIEVLKPLLVIVSPMCREALKDKRAAAVANLEFAVELYCAQVKRGYWFLHEQPWTAASWKLECVRTRLST